jgi:hypothetical protein
MPKAMPSRAGLQTIGSADGFGGRERLPPLDLAVGPIVIFRFRGDKIPSGDRRFESGFLQQRVSNELRATPRLPEMEIDRPA